MFLTAFAIRLYYAHTLYLNLDECLHVNAGSSAQWAVYHHPPLLFVWLWAATLVSHQEWWLRLMPVVTGALTPVLLVLWLRRWMHPVTAWGLAALAAFAPNLVLLSIQLRGYPMALAGTAAALYALDRAFAEVSRRWLVLHFAALTVAILAEFMTAWVALAMGLYGLLRLAREPEMRRLLSAWVAGQSAALGLYAVLYWTVVRPVVARTDAQQLIQTYLRGGFPQPGENLFAFVATGWFKQFVYFSGSLSGGLLAAVLALIGLIVWLRQKDSRILLVLALTMTACGAIAQFYPFGRSRHTAAIGLVCLGAMGVGLEAFAQRWRPARWVAPLFLLTVSLATPLPDVHNVDLQGWSKAKWSEALAKLQREVPPGATLLADYEAFQMLQANLAPRHMRYQTVVSAERLEIGNFAVKPSRGEWKRVPMEWVTAEAAVAAATGSVWVIDSGFDMGAAETNLRKLGMDVVIDEPGVLFLARLRR